MSEASWSAPQEAAAPLARPSDDPRRNEFSIVDLAIGGTVAASTIPVVGLVHGIVWFSPAPEAFGLVCIVAYVAALIGIPVVTLVGVPLAALASFLLRPVRSEAVHLLVFALLGAGGFLAIAAEGSPDALWFTGYGVVPVVVGRWSGRCFADARHRAEHARSARASQPQ